jgi:hypothetical protein
MTKKKVHRKKRESKFLFVWGEMNGRGSTSRFFNFLWTLLWSGEIFRLGTQKRDRQNRCFYGKQGVVALFSTKSAMVNSFDKGKM